MKSISKKVTGLTCVLALSAASLILSTPAQAAESTQLSCSLADGTTLRANQEWSTTKTSKGYENTFTANANSGAQSVTIVSGHKPSKAPKEWKPTRTVTVFAKTNKTKVTATLHKSQTERCDIYAFTYTKPLPTPPQAPTKLTAKPGNGEVRLSWSPPEDSGGEKITGYTVYMSSATTGAWETAAGPTTKTSATISGLVNGNAYRFRVTASSVVGEGAAATTDTVIPVGPPSAPQSLVVTVGDRQASLAWSPPANTGGSPVTEYTVYRSTTSATGPWSRVGDTSDAFRTVTSLKNGTTYWFKVTASNSVGESEDAAISDSVIPAARPGAPRSLQAEAGNASATLTWSPPSSDGGAPVTGYNVYHSRGSANGPWTLFAGAVTATSASITGLVNGTPYWFRVTALNRTGEGEGDTDGPETPFTTPDAVRDLAATPEDKKVLLVWSAPSFDGGSSVKDYVIQYRSSGSGSWQTVSDGTSSRTTATVSSLTNGISYDFQVAAVNASGTGAFTGISNITPLGKFEAPELLDAQISQRDSEQMLLTFEPDDNGGRTIVGAEYSTDGGITWQTPVSSTTSTLATQPATVTLNGYSYLVRLVASNGDRSPASKAVSKPTSRPSLTVEALKKAYEREGTAGLDLSWKSTSRTTFYKLLPMVGNASQLPFNLDSETLKMRETGLNWNTQYGYMIAACNAGGCSTYSAEVKGTTNPRPGAWRVRDAGESKIEVTVPDLPAGAVSYRIRYCDATASPGCDPDLKSSFNRSYSEAGSIKISVKTKRSYNVIVVFCTESKGGGNQTVTLAKNISVTSAK